MGTLSLSIDTENAAFDGNGSNEISRILTKLAEDIANGVEYPSIRDINGNTVGKCEYTKSTSELEMSERKFTAEELGSYHAELQGIAECIYESQAVINDSEGTSQESRESAIYDMIDHVNDFLDIIEKLEKDDIAFPNGLHPNGAGRHAGSIQASLHEVLSAKEVLEVSENEYGMGL